MANPRSTSTSVREQKLARVIDREVAPIWHDRFARLLMRELPSDPETFALDIHSGPGHTTAELLQRLDESSRIVALGRDPWLMQVSKTRVRPEWKRRVYFKSGDIDDVTGMNDDTYNLAVANLVLGEQVVEWQPALAELLRVTKPGGQVLTTLPLHGTWQEVEDLFEEMLRDEGMRREVATLQKLRRRRPKPAQIVAGLRGLGLGEHDFIVEHERFELLFRSGREFLFAPVIEHGPLRLWKAIIGQAEKPQALFWRFKEAIDTYYAEHVLAVTVVAGLIRLRVPGGSGGSFATSFAGGYWSRYPTLARLWGGPGSEALDASEDEFDFDLDIDLDEADAAIDALTPSDSTTMLEASDSGMSFGDSGPGFADIEVSGVNELPAVEDVALGDEGDDPFAGLLDELDAEEAVAAEIAAEDAEVEAAVQPRERAPSARVATLGAMEHSPLPEKLPTKPPESGSVPPAAAKPRVSLASKLPGRKPGDSGSSPLPGKLPAKPKIATKLSARKTGGVGSLASKLPRREASGVTPLPPKLPRREASGVTAIPPKLGEPSDGVSAPGQARRKPTDTKSLLARLPKRTPTGKSAVTPPPTGPSPTLVTSKAAKPSVTAKPTGPQPRVTKPGEEDPFASMLADDEDDDLEEIDDIEELPGDSLIHGEFDDEDLADSFGKVSPDPAAGRSGTRPVPPPPPKKE